MGGKRTTIEAERPATGKEIRLPAIKTIKEFNSAYDDVKTTIDEANKQLKTDAEAAKKGHLNMWAFKAVKKLFDDFEAADNEVLASEKLAIKLAQFDELRKHYKLDELANLQGRMFGVGEIGSKAPPRELDEDGEPDPRPNHLRQPGASAAEPAKSNPVADMAEKAGAKTNPIDSVGRGPKLN